MSTGLAVFDTTVQETNEWLRDIESRLPPCTRQHAYSALRATLHLLRDHLPMDAVLGLSAQLPMLLRGVLFEGWRPATKAARTRDPEALMAELKAHLPAAFPREPDMILEAVAAVLSSKVNHDEARKLVQHIPVPLRVFWPRYLSAP